ncbi:MGH1-like glycoside hydrolase domain-containing protein [Shewanella pealeana]|uniref:Glycoside hydrolase family 37 n=1 Tax=Shewanella pealeana (strain ATCC 700345 / ANG-SQ1) TaxID=398579 RepID=A8HA74_SHEPA|nr:trehalase family glycosidase [Shewanella pealeana]ABV89461.1 glycoside hydrolase family 37 [Shewanella pealeana ATCC 700345]
MLNCLLLCIASLSSLDSADYQNLLPYQGTPTSMEQRDNKGNLTIGSVYTDQGAWHGFHLPDNADYYGSFTGPLFIAQEYSLHLSDSLQRLQLINIDKDEFVSLDSASRIEIYSRPDALVQSFTWSDFQLNLSLSYSDNRTAVIRTELVNLSNKPQTWQLVWHGTPFSSHPSLADYRLIKQAEVSANHVSWQLNPIMETWRIQLADAEYELWFDRDMKITLDEQSGYRAIAEPMILDAGQQHTFISAQRYFHTQAERTAHQAPDWSKIDSQLLDNQAKWQARLDRAIKGGDKSSRQLAVKSMLTLVHNWRSPAGALQHDAITPSITYKWFNGVWAWDSWKQAVALARFDPELAKSNVLAMFDYQFTSQDPLRPQDAGNLPDAIFYNKDRERGGEGGNWNERNGKPPLSAWAVWQIYLQDKDEAFLNIMYPKLVAYHEWWYRNRDNNDNGLAEYGANLHPMHLNEDGSINPQAVIEAAAWESGMDNAPRFDMDDALDIWQNRQGGQLVGYSVSQESVDLNAYLYAEKRFLEQIAAVLGDESAAEKWDLAATRLAKQIQMQMYDAESGFFYDIRYTPTGSELMVKQGKGVEGWIPLWAGAASEAQAKIIVERHLNETQFGTLIPFPTVSADSPNFAAAKYWRGPVWLDQALFGLQGVERYGYHEQAQSLAKQLVVQGEGILGQSPIRENYNPLTGEGLHCTNFSWSASVLLLIYQSWLTDVGDE